MAIPRNFYARIINERTGRPITPRTSNAALIAGRFTEATRQVGAINMSSLVTAAALAADEGAAEAMTIFARSLRNQYARTRTTELRNLHTKIAEDAQQSMLRKYDTVVGARSLGEYRSRVSNPRWKRYSGGQLRRALARSDFYRASQDGILWANMDMLDRRAKQWYRLNYGAGPRGAGHRAQQAYPSATMKFFDQKLTESLIPASYSASGAYMMPRGVFADIDKLGLSQQGRFSKVRLPGRTRRGGGAMRGSPAELGIPRLQSLDRNPRGNERIQAEAGYARTAFHPVGYVGSLGFDTSTIPKVGPRMTRGFAGTFFIEAGLSRMSKTLPAAYEQLAVKWFKEAATTETGPVSKIINTRRADRLMQVVSRDIERLASQRQLNKFLRGL